MQLLCLTGIWGQSAQTSAAMSASATRTDSLYTFRFVQGKDAFYVPWRENGTQLGQLTDLLQSHREAVVNGSIPVVVNGYCTGQASRQENLHMAAVHSNRVKSELIVRTDITEDCFKTANHAAEYNGLRNVVTVTLRIPVAEGDLRTERDFSSVNDTDSADSGNKRKPETSVQPAAPAQSEKRTQTEASTQPKVSVSSAPSADEKSLAPFSFRLNLLRWATLTPDLGIEYRPGHTPERHLDLLELAAQITPLRPLEPLTPDTLLPGHRAPRLPRPPLPNGRLQLQAQRHRTPRQLPRHRPHRRLPLDAHPALGHRLPPRRRLHPCRIQQIHPY